MKRIGQTSRSKILIPISINSNKNYNFENLIHHKDSKILICDSLNRFNHRIKKNISYEESYLYSIYEGKELYENFQKSGFKDISKWDEYRTTEETENLMYIFKILYTTSKDFKLAIDNTVHQVLDRYIKKEEQIYDKNRRIFDLCFEYIIEKIAVITYLNRIEKYTTLLYPKNPSPIFKYLLKKPVLEMKWININ